MNYYDYGSTYGSTASNAGLAALGIGFIIKYSLSFIDNKYIPLIMGITGIAFNIFVNSGSITPVVIVGGLISGLASTGLYEMFRNFISKE